MNARWAMGEVEDLVTLGFLCDASSLFQHRCDELLSQFGEVWHVFALTPQGFDLFNDSTSRTIQ